MYYGTMLGIIWSIMNVLMFIGLKSPVLLLTCIALFIGSPFFAASFAKKYRRNECGNCIRYMQAFTFLYWMYICACLLSALVMFLYFRFIDNGMFFATIQEVLTASMNFPGIDEAYRQQAELSLQTIQNSTTSEFVWYILGNNIFNASILPFIIAIFVRRNNKG
jgi:hypothetical protein